MATNFYGFQLIFSHVHRLQMKFLENFKYMRHFDIACSRIMWLCYILEWSELFLYVQKALYEVPYVYVSYAQTETRKFSIMV